MATLNFKNADIEMTTSHSFDNTRITSYEGLVVSNVTYGRHIGRDILSSLRDFFGGRSRSWEKTLKESQQQALDEMAAQAKERGANAVIGIDMTDEAIGSRGEMMNVKVMGTAVVIEQANA